MFIRNAIAILIAGVGLALAFLASGAFLGCAADQAKAVGHAELVCAEEAAPDLLVAVTQALATGGLENPAAWVAPMTQLALARGADEVRCAVLALLAKSPSLPVAAAETLAPVFPEPALNNLTRPRAARWLATK